MHLKPNSCEYFCEKRFRSSPLFAVRHDFTDCYFLNVLHKNEKKGLHIKPLLLITNDNRVAQYRCPTQLHLI